MTLLFPAVPAPACAPGGPLSRRNAPGRPPDPLATWGRLHCKLAINCPPQQYLSASRTPVNIEHLTSRLLGGLGGEGGWRLQASEICVVRVEVVQCGMEVQDAESN